LRLFFRKILGHHLNFIFNELVAIKTETYFCRTRLKGCNRFLMRVLSSYLDSFLFTINVRNRNKPRKIAASQEVCQLLDNGFSYLKKVDLRLIDFVTINEKKERTTTPHKVDVVAARKFAKKMNFDLIAKDYLGVGRCNFHARAWRLNASPIVNSYHGNLDWHRDRDGYSELKFFVLLSDTLKGEGEHSIAVGSHLIKPLKFVPQRRYKDEEVLKDFNVVDVFGKKGTCFVEDTSCLHKGASPASRNRDILQFVYFTGPVYWDPETMPIDLES
jgi:hypothetical protein